MKKKYGVFIGFAALLLTAAFIFAACSDPNKDDDPPPPYNAGTKTGYAHGVNNSPVTPIQVSVTVDGNGRITALHIDSHNESVYHNYSNIADGVSNAPRIAAAVANSGEPFYDDEGAVTETQNPRSMVAKLVGKNASEIDTVDATTGATMTSDMIKLATKEAVWKAAAASSNSTPVAGDYTGYGWARYQGAKITVAATVAANGSFTVTSITPASGTDLSNDNITALIAKFNEAQSYIIEPLGEGVTFNAVGANTSTAVVTGANVPQGYKAQFGAMEAVKDIMLQAKFPATAFKDRPADKTLSGTPSLTLPNPPAVDATVTFETTSITPASGTYMHRLYRKAAASVYPTEDNAVVWSGVSEVGPYPLVAADNGTVLKIKVGTTATGYWGGYVEAKTTSAVVWEE